MSVSSTSTDPVDTIIDILDGTAQSNWPNGTKPSTIEKQWEHTFQWKKNQANPAAYVWSPERGSQDQFGPDHETKIRGETIDVDVWALDDSNVDSISGDVISILEDYWMDSQENTQWDRIRPESPDDRRAEKLARMTDHYVVSVRVALEREASMGT